MTPLIDVIFLLLLFFMLTSTFTRFSEVELSAAGAGTAVHDAQPVFLKLNAQTLSVNGTQVSLDALAARLSARETGEALPVLVSLGTGVTAQRLTDLLGVLRQVPDVRATVLGAS